MIRRREFITLLGGAAAVWPLGAVAEQLGKVWRVGFIAGGARPVPLDRSPFAGFLHGMRELGYVEGRDFTIEWRFAEARYELFPDFAAEFARLKVDVVVTTFAPAAHAMRQTNPSIPIVLAYFTDPVAPAVLACGFTARASNNLMLGRSVLSLGLVLIRSLGIFQRQQHASFASPIQPGRRAPREADALAGQHLSAFAF